MKAGIGNRRVKCHESVSVLQIFLVHFPVKFRITERFLIVLFIHKSNCQPPRNHGFHQFIRGTFYVLLPFFYGLIIAVQLHEAVNHIPVYGRQAIVLLHRAAPRQADGIQGQFQRFLPVMEAIVFLGQLQRNPHVPGMLLQFLQEQTDISPGMFPGFLLRLVDIAVMMHKCIQALCLARSPAEAFVNPVDKLYVRLQADQPPYQHLRIVRPLHGHVIADRIEPHPVDPVLAGIEKPDDVRHVLKPFVIIHVHEPFPSGPFQACIPGPGKIPAPFKIHNIVRVFLNDAPHLFPASRVHQDQLGGHFSQQRLDRIKAFPHGIRTVGNQDGYGQ